MQVQLREYKPSEYLVPFIESFWEGSINKEPQGQLEQKVLPSGYVELIIHLSELHCDLFIGDKWSQSPVYTLFGVYTEPYEVKFKGQVNVFAIRFKPEGFYSIFGLPAALFKSTYDDMEMVLDKKFYSFCHRIREAETVSAQIQIAESFLLNRVQRNNCPITYLNMAAEKIRKNNGFLLVEELAKDSFISVRQLEREFANKIGISPKQYMKLARFNEVHRLLNANAELPFTKLAYHCGYADQAHFIRDFKSFAGENPKVYQKGRHLFFRYL
jgi:AraC-like DNA-binding protein